MTALQKLPGALLRARALPPPPRRARAAPGCARRRAGQAQSGHVDDRLAVLVRGKIPGPGYAMVAANVVKMAGGKGAPGVRAPSAMGFG